MGRPPFLQPVRVVLSAWPWRAAAYLVGVIAGGLVSWVAVGTVFLFPVWAGVWARLERRLAALRGGETASGERRGAVTWRALVHCLVSVPLSTLGVMGALGLVATLLSTLLAPLQPVVPFDSLWWFTPRTTAESVGAVAAGLLLVPVLGWVTTTLAVGVEALCAGILAPRAEALARQVDTLRSASLRAEDDVLAERRRPATIVVMTAQPLREVRDHFSDVVDRVEFHHERVTVTRNGRPVAVLISPEDLSALEETLDVLSDPEALADIREADTARAAGDVVRGVDAVRALRR